MGGAGLGVVELTVALHYVFDTPRDRLLWDADGIEKRRGAGHDCIILPRGASSAPCDNEFRPLP